MHSQEVQIATDNLSTVAFYHSGSSYVIDENSLNHALIRAKDLFDRVDGVYQAAPEFKQAKNDFQTFKQKMLATKIPAKEFESYLNTHVKSKTIINFLKLRDSLTLIFLPFISFDYPDTVADHNQLDHQKDETPDDYVLNHHNPFADVKIDNQAFLYPDLEGNFHTLAFNNGMTLTCVQNANGNSLALRPNFKVAKSKKIIDLSQPINVDDSVSSLLPEKRDQHVLYYL